MPKTLKKLRTAQIPTHLSDSRKQEGHEKVVWTAHSGPTQKARKYDRELLRIPVRLQLQGKEFSGFSHDFSPAGLQIIVQTALKTGTPLALQCTFGEVCYLNLSAQVVFCQPANRASENVFSLGIKFSAIRDWEDKILGSAIQELKQGGGQLEKSLLTVHVTEDTMALDAADWYTHTEITLAQTPRTIRRSCIHTSKIIGWGAYLPPNEITNQDISAMLNLNGGKTNFGDVVGTLTGIKSRRYAGSRIYPSDLAVEASIVALRNAGIDPKDLEVIISCGVARDVEEPATAYIIQEKLGAHNAYCFDLANACNGFLSAVDVLDSFIASGRCEIGLVTGGEVISQYINWDPETRDELRLSTMGYTLGDGGGAAVLTRVTAGDQRGLKASWFLSDSSYWRAAVVPLMNSSKRLFMSNGVEIERAALEYVPTGVEETMRMLEWDVDDIDLIIPHQVASHIIENLFYKTLHMPPEKVYWSFPRHGNVGAASIPVALCEALNEGRAKIGDKVLLVGGSGGFGVGVIGLVL